MSIEGLSKALTLKSGRSKSDQAPEGQQVAALCYRFEKKALRVLLITSRDTGRWVLPKGWMMGGMTAADAAAQEAWEEAGVVGGADDQAVGYFSYDKILPSPKVWRGSRRAPKGNINWHAAICPDQYIHCIGSAMQDFAKRYRSV